MSNPYELPPCPKCGREATHYSAAVSLWLQHGLECYPLASVGGNDAWSADDIEPPRNAAVILCVSVDGSVTRCAKRIVLAERVNEQWHIRMENQ